ncbi:MAG: chromosome partitioning protein, partial [Nitrosopumilus sp.]|nr:chromosome partitioning protein [Nitrosopumilus sp.]MBT7781088.1 chromosome partitioning protein [Nitrosopumilus sp.]
SGKPIMITHVESPSADAFRASAKNVAAQCSIIASNLQDEMESEPQSESSDEIQSENVTT